MGWYRVVNMALWRLGFVFVGWDTSHADVSGIMKPSKEAYSTHFTYGKVLDIQGLPGGRSTGTCELTGVRSCTYRPIWALEDPPCTFSHPEFPRPPPNFQHFDDGGLHHTEFCVRMWNVWPPSPGNYRNMRLSSLLLSLYWPENLDALLCEGCIFILEMLTNLLNSTPWKPCGYYMYHHV
jgi:hypothetical protein